MPEQEDKILKRFRSVIGKLDTKVVNLQVGLHEFGIIESQEVFDEAMEAIDKKVDILNKELDLFNTELSKIQAAINNSIQGNNDE